VETKLSHLYYQTVHSDGDTDGDGGALTGNDVENCALIGDSLIKELPKR